MPKPTVEKAPQLDVIVTVEGTILGNLLWVLLDHLRKSAASFFSRSSMVCCAGLVWVGWFTMTLISLSSFRYAWRIEAIA